MSSSTTKTISQEFQILIKKENQHDKIVKITPLIVLGILVVFFAFCAPGFFTVAGILTVITQLAVPLIVALGLTFVVLVGSIDLSIDGVIGFCSAIISLIVLNSKTTIALGVWGIPVVLIVGAFIGFLTGFMNVKGKIPSFMVSFAMLNIASGLAITSYNAIPPQVTDPIIRGISLQAIAGLPIYVYIALVVFLVALIIEHKTAFGKYMFAVGENEELCKVSGINSSKVRIMVFVWAGLVIGIAGIIGTAQIGRGDVAIGTGQMFRALAAVVLGGTALSGGKGGVINTLIGALIITILDNGLVLMSTNPYFKDAIIGAVLVLAVILSTDRNPKLITK